MWNIAVELFIVGVSVSFGVCFFSCSPIILSYIAGVGKGWKDGIKSILIFSFTQLVIAGILGSLFGLFGSFAGQIMKQYKQLLFLIAGIIIALIGLLVFFRKGHIFFCYNLTKKYTNDNIIKGSFFLGIITGILPCLPFMAVYTYIFFKASNIWQGAFLGFAFGLGKFISPLIPLSILAGSLSKILSKNKKISMVFTKICGIVIFYMGVKLILPILHLNF